MGNVKIISLSGRLCYRPMPFCRSISRRVVVCRVPNRNNCKGLLGGYCEWLQGVVDVAEKWQTIGFAGQLMDQIDEVVWGCRFI